MNNIELLYPSWYIYRKDVIAVKIISYQEDKMNPKKALGILIILLAVLGLARAAFDIHGDMAGRADSSSIKAPHGSIPEGKVEYAIYFFEGNTPCPVCEKIRAMTLNLESTGNPSISQFSVKEINVDEPGNEIYILDLGLFSTSVVLAEESDGLIYRWENLEAVWDLSGDEESFRRYLIDEADSFLEGADTR
jgi:hypothetical protein